MFKQIILTAVLVGTLFSQNFILKNENIISEKAAKKIESIGGEFYAKLSVPIYLLAIENLDGKKIANFNKDYAKTLKAPFVLLTFAKNDRKVDIFLESKEKIELDKEYVLDDIIIPILVTKSKKNSLLSKHSAALLSGYSDIAEQIASSKNVTLENAIGNASKNFIHWIRIFIYGSMLGVLLLYLYKRMNK